MSNNCETCGSSDGHYGNKYILTNSSKSFSLKPKPNIPDHPTRYAELVATTKSTMKTNNTNRIILNYGCVKFTTAGDVYFNLTNDSAENCVSHCLLQNIDCKFFITSFYTG